MSRQGAPRAGAKLISIIGPVGVGKTTLAERLCEQLPAGLIREDYAGNPFLTESYVGSARARLPGQVHFLLSRVAQLSVLSWPADGLFVSDYGYCQDGVYAQLRLSEDDLDLYERIAARVAPLVRPPEVVICLDASVETLLGRIASRGRGHERVMDAGFMQRMRRAYADLRPLLARRTPGGVLDVDCDEVDFNRPADMSQLLGRIRGKLQS